MSADPRYSTYRWRLLRRAVRQRDGGRCQLQLAGCTGLATQADHKQEPGPPALGRDDLFFDIANLQASCRSCNVAKRNTRTATLAGQALGISSDWTLTEKTHANWSREWAPCQCNGCQHRRNTRST
jgi:5-methylcytosine-specific restriction endonuclease McrA